MTYNFDELNNLSEEERKLALSILEEFSKEGTSKVFEDLKYADFEEIPVDIETFLHDRQYLGNALYDPDGRFTLFPYWENKLKEIFPTNVDTRYNTIILTGAIGLGKSTVAVICQLYLLYRLLCLKDPYLYYGMQPIDKISISMMNITIENAKGVALDKMNQMILSSEWFMTHGKMTGESNLIFKPDKHIEIITASSNNQIIGRALFCLDGDTIIKTEYGYDKIKDLYKKENIRVVSLDDNGNEILSDYCSVEPTVKTDEEIQIELEDGTVIKCTPNHRLMLKDGTYKEVQYLTENDELYDIQKVNNTNRITYNEFIQNIINTRGQWNIPKDKYWEGHHIVPKCMGGEGRATQKHPNIVRLYAQEHFIAHKLLAEENPTNRKLVAAWSMMAFPKGKTKREFAITPDEYAELREMLSNFMKTNTPILKNGHPWNYGKKGVYSEETLKKIRAPRPHTRGIKKSKETKEKMSIALKKRLKENPKMFGGQNKGKIGINNGVVKKYINKDEKIPEGFVLGTGKNAGYNIKDPIKLHEIRSKATSGERNPMYGKGYKISGGKNGHAIYIYNYLGKDYDCRDDLMIVLKEQFPKISESAIRKIMSGKYTKRISSRFQFVIDNLTWRLKKDENQIDQTC